MPTRSRFGVRALALVLMFTTGAQAQKPAEPTPEEVRAAIQRGVDFLKSQQDRSGSWDSQVPSMLINAYTGGPSALALLALLEAGVEPSDPTIQSGLKYLRGLPNKHTYVVALVTMVFCLAEPRTDLVLIKRNVDWLMSTARAPMSGGLAWGYPIRGDDRTVDQSNTQYAILALREAAQIGVTIPDQSWLEIQKFYLATQLGSGGWSYPEKSPNSERLTMTTAGVCGLLISGMQLFKNNETIRANGTIENCGQFQKNDPLARGLDRLGSSFYVTVRPRFLGLNAPYYNLYGVERAGRLSGERFFTSFQKQPIDWYREGVRELLKVQRANGSWFSEDAQLDGARITATSFALLFLAKGKTPVLIHKLKHGDRSLTGDWNNDRNDVRNLTDYCSKNVFRKKGGRPTPLTWQIFDGANLSPDNPGAVADLLQAPIAFCNGHLAPRFRDSEKKLLQKYVEQGGFIFAEACCSRPEFDLGFRKLCKELFPDRPLLPLPPGHPIWNAAYQVPPGAFNLHGIDLGCKTVLVYAPQDLSCHWETNRPTDGDARTVLAYRLGANVVAYATGLEPPEDKLSAKKVIVDKEEPIRRNFLQAAQLNYGARDWQPAPNAMRALMSHLQSQRMDVILQTKPIGPEDASLARYKFLYMHGRSEFSLSATAQEKLRGHLEAGGLLLADACCGSAAFDRSFRELIQSSFGRPLEPIRGDDPLLNGEIGVAVRSVMGRTRPGQSYEPLSPQLEGVRADPKDPKSRWLIIYSKLDLGCALDRHTSADCVGYNHESALAIAAQAVYYTLRE